MSTPFEKVEAQKTALKAMPELKHLVGPMELEALLAIYRRARSFSCTDGFCGADDCRTCHPEIDADEP